MNTPNRNQLSDQELLTFLSKEENLSTFEEKEIPRKGDMTQKVIDLPTQVAQRLEEILGKKNIIRNKTVILMLTKNKLYKEIVQPIEIPKNYDQLKQAFLKTQEAKLQQGVKDWKITIDPHYFPHTQQQANRKKGNSIEEVLKAIRGFDQNFTAKGTTPAEKREINQKYLVLDPNKLEKYPEVLDVLLHQKREKGYTLPQEQKLVHEMMQNAETCMQNFFNNHQKICVSAEEITDEIKNRERSINRIRKSWDIEIPRFDSEKIFNDRIIRITDKQGKKIYIRSKNPNYIYQEKYKSRYQGRKEILEIFTTKEALISELQKEEKSTRKQIEDIQWDRIFLSDRRRKLFECQDKNDRKEIIENAIQYGSQNNYPFKQDIKKTMIEIQNLKHINKGHIEKMIESLQNKANPRMNAAIHINSYLTAYIKELHKIEEAPSKKN